VDWQVRVSGVDYPVTAIQHGNGKWTVSGAFMGRRVLGEAKSLQGASTKWKELAEHYERE